MFDLKVSWRSVLMRVMGFNSNKVAEWQRYALRLSISVVLFGLLGTCITFPEGHNNLESNYRQACNWAAVTSIVVTAPLTGKVAQVTFDRMAGTAIGCVYGISIFVFGFGVMGPTWGGIFIALMAAPAITAASYVVGQRKQLEQLGKFFMLTYCIVALAAKPQKNAFVLSLMRVSGVFAGGLVGMVVALLVLPKSASVEALREMKKMIKVVQDVNQKVWQVPGMPYAELDKGGCPTDSLAAAPRVTAAPGSKNQATGARSPPSSRPGPLAESFLRRKGRGSDDDLAHLPPQPDNDAGNAAVVTRGSAIVNEAAGSSTSRAEFGGGRAAALRMRSLAGPASEGRTPAEAMGAPTIMHGLPEALGTTAGAGRQGSSLVRITVCEEAAPPRAGWMTFGENGTAVGRGCQSSSSREQLMASKRSHEGSTDGGIEGQPPSCDDSEEEGEEAEDREAKRREERDTAIDAVLVSLHTSMSKIDDYATQSASEVYIWHFWGSYFFLPGPPWFPVKSRWRLPVKDIKRLTVYLRNLAKMLWTLRLEMEELAPELLLVLEPEDYPRDLLRQLADKMTAAMQDLIKAFPGDTAIEVDNLLVLGQLAEGLHKRTTEAFQKQTFGVFPSRSLPFTSSTANTNNTGGGYTSNGTTGLLVPLPSLASATPPPAAPPQDAQRLLPTPSLPAYQLGDLPVDALARPLSSVALSYTLQQQQQRRQNSTTADTIAGYARDPIGAAADSTAVPTGCSPTSGQLGGTGTATATGRSTPPSGSGCASADSGGGGGGSGGSSLHRGGRSGISFVSHLLADKPGEQVKLQLPPRHKQSRLAGTSKPAGSGASSQPPPPAQQQLRLPPPQRPHPQQNRQRAIIARTATPTVALLHALSSIPSTVSGTLTSAPSLPRAMGASATAAAAAGSSSNSTATNDNNMIAGGSGQGAAGIQRGPSMQQRQPGAGLVGGPAAPDTLATCSRQSGETAALAPAAVAAWGRAQIPSPATTNMEVSPFKSYALLDQQGIAADVAEAYSLHAASSVRTIAAGAAIPPDPTLTAPGVPVLSNPLNSSRGDTHATAATVANTNVNTCKDPCRSGGGVSFQLPGTEVPQLRFPATEEGYLVQVRWFSFQFIVNSVVSEMENAFAACSKVMEKLPYPLDL